MANFSCDVCGKVFKKQHGLRMHQIRLGHGAQNGHKEMTATELIQVLKVKRDSLTEIIKEMEVYTK